MLGLSLFFYSSIRTFSLSLFLCFFWLWVSLASLQVSHASLQQASPLTGFFGFALSGVP